MITLDSRRARAASFTLSNGQGSFAFFGSKPSEKYQGFFARLGEVFRVVENIATTGKVQQLDYNFASAKRTRNADETYFVPLHSNALCYEVSKPSPIRLTLDCRKQHDFRQYGRNYTVELRDREVVITFKKVTDSNEDQSHGQEEFTLFVVIRHNGSFAPKEHWTQRHYEDDVARNSAPDRWVYSPGQLTATRVVISVALSEEEARAEAHHIYDSLPRRKELYMQYLSKLKGSAQRITLQAAMQQLLTPEGVYAGLPWFTQHWSRDTFIALSALPRSLQKRIILTTAEHITNQGDLPSIMSLLTPQLQSDTASSDAVGWLFFRADQLYRAGEWNSYDMRRLVVVLRKAIAAIEQHKMRDGLVWSNKNDTWMDTAYNDDGREGFPIEVQTLLLRMYHTLWRWSGDREVHSKEQALRARVRKHFLVGGVLHDRKGDATPRPNVFIAAYIYPELLSQEEWKTCFDLLIPTLWLDWGGLASIDKAHANYQPYYTGEDNRSYHRGDSWYWLNNLAAMVLHRVDAKAFDPHIHKILNASLRDVFWQGAIGCSSEVSSAAEQQAAGCLNQAWSNAFLLELMDELKLP